MVTLNGQVLRRESVCAYSNARFLTDSMFEFAERLNAMRLNDSEIGLFNAVIVIASGKCSLILNLFSHPFTSHNTIIIIISF